MCLIILRMSDASLVSLSASSASGSAPPPPSLHLTLYGYWRSGSTWRVRLALQLKGLPYTSHAVNLLAAEQQQEEYTRLNPAQAVPTLVVRYEETEQQFVLAQSGAILEWLEDTHPQPTPLLPIEPSHKRTQRTSQGAAEPHCSSCSSRCL